jgi:hypothetical protein
MGGGGLASWQCAGARSAAAWRPGGMRADGRTGDGGLGAWRRTGGWAEAAWAPGGVRADGGVRATGRRASR